MKWRRIGVTALFAKVGWRRPALATWTVQGRDELGRASAARVELHPDGVVLRSRAEGPLTLTPLQVGKLRSALREAVFDYLDLRAAQGDDGQDSCDDQVA